MKGRTGASDKPGAVSKGGFNAQHSKNMQRLGGKGLSLQAFANAKSQNRNDYNPALIKRKREFYKNANFIKKFKKSSKHENDHQEDAPVEGTNEAEKAPKKYGLQSLEEVYKQKREKEEKARLEKEQIIRARKDEKMKAEKRRKSLKGNMFKKTRSGQPVMKYRIEQILETLQGSSS